MCKIQSKKKRVYLLNIDTNCANNQLDLAVKISEYDVKSKIIFIGYHREYSFQAIIHHIEPLDFIMITPDFEQLQKNIFSALSVAYHRLQFQLNEKEKLLRFRFDKLSYQLLLDEVISVETVGNHRLVVKTFTNNYEFIGSLSKIAEDYPLFSISRSVLINPDNVKKKNKLWRLRNLSG